jgi:nucleoside-diphosphate-sugar epimerase
MKRKRYLVTGGLGFLGSALARALSRAGNEVRVLDDGSRGAVRRLAEDARNIEVVYGDVRDAQAVYRAVAGVDAVCHFAYVNGTRFFYEKPAYVLEVGVKGIVHVLDGCVRAGVGELLLASSSEVYQTPPSVPTDESAPLSVPDPHNPRFSYAGGKILGELMALNYGKEYFHRVLIVRPHNVYGPDMGREHVVPEFILRMRELARGGPGPISFPIQGSGRETRAFIFIDDFIEGLLSVIEKGEHLNIYNVGNDEEIAIETVAREVAGYFGREIEIVPGPTPAGSTARRCPDISKLRRLGFTPRHSFLEGLARTARWYDEHAADERPVEPAEKAP